jgi:hypothetical protein
MDRGGGSLNERILATITAKGIRRTEFAQKLNIPQAIYFTIQTGCKYR